MRLGTDPASAHYDKDSANICQELCFIGVRLALAARFAAVARVALSRRLLQSISSRPSFSAWRGESVMRPLISPSLVRRMLSGPCSSLRRVILVSWL